MSFKDLQNLIDDVSAIIKRDEQPLKEMFTIQRKDYTNLDAIKFQPGSEVKDIKGNKIEDSKSMSEHSGITKVATGYMIIVRNPVNMEAYEHHLDDKSAKNLWSYLNEKFGPKDNAVKDTKDMKKFGMPKDDKISKDDVSQIADFDSKKKDKDVNDNNDLDKNNEKFFFEKKKKEEPENNDDDESEYDDVDEKDIPEDKKPKFDFSKLKKKDK